MLFNDLIISENNDNKILKNIGEKINIQYERLQIEKKDNILIKDVEIIKLFKNKIYFLYFEFYENLFYSFNNQIEEDFIKINNNNFLIFDDENELQIKNLNENELNIIIYEINDLIKNNESELIQNLNFDSKYYNYNKDCIFIFENKDLITDKLCNDIINIINNSENLNIEKWAPQNNVNCKYINVNHILDDELKKYLDDCIFKIINYIINILYKEYNIKCSGDSGYCLRKIYGPTRLHSDGIDIEPIDNRYIPIKKIRNMSIIIALNEDYEDGEFYFPRQDKKIKLKKGQIIAFPPYWTHPHMVYSPSNGTYRYTINTWLYQ